MGKNKYEKSSLWFERAQKVIPGGVNSPVRAFRSVGREPIFADRAEGATLWDVDGNAYTDFICSWGPMILGHGHPILLKDIDKVFAKGTSYGIPSALEVEMAELLCEAYSALDMVRMVSSGTEATMSAIRVARGYTHRNKIIKFEGCYHGHSDALLVKSGSGTLTYGVPTSPGVPEDVVKDTLVCRYNDLASVEKVFANFPKEVACIIVEPIAGNMGVVPATKEFLQGLRDLCDAHGTVLIFDEVITGFRLAYGGASEVFDITPDMVCFGKIIGGGLPVGAYGGRKDIMSVVSPIGPVYQAGTLSGNPLAMHYGIQTLSYLKAHPEIYVELEEKAKRIEEGLKAIIEQHQFPIQVVRFMSMPCLFFIEGNIQSYDDVKACNTELYANYFREMLDRGYLLPPAQFEGLFLSLAHTDEMIDQFVKDSGEVLQSIFK